MSKKDHLVWYRLILMEFYKDMPITACETYKNFSTLIDKLPRQ